MALSTFLYIVSVLLLFHSAYSVYEFSYFSKHISSLISVEALPLDIKIEAGFGVIIATLAAILAKANTLKPIAFSEAIIEEELKGKSSFGYLERRTIFESIGKRRSEYSNWLDQQSKK